MLAPNLPFIAPDAIFALTKQYNVDTSARDYKDEAGDPYILPSVKLAKKQVEGSNHEYLPILGLPLFREQAVKLVLGDESPVIRGKKVASSQALSGTGALHLAGAFLRRASDSTTKVYITEPSWSNHRAVFEAVGFPVQSYAYLDEAGRFNFTSLVETLEQASAGSIFVFHACAHNPSGCDPSKKQWKEIASIMQQRSLFPLFDAAYLGLTSGDFEEDAYAIRYFLNDLGMEAAVCLSFAKNMGLYGERVGAVVFASESTEDARIVESHLEQLQRAEISNPPAFGARVVSTVLQDPAIRSAWENDLKHMSRRLSDMRQRLYQELEALGCPRDFRSIVEQVGMFCILRLDIEQVLLLRDRYHIYMADSSRVSIAGLNGSNVAYVAKAIDEVVRGEY